MTAVGRVESVRWFSRTVDPPEDIPRLRQVLGGQPGGVMLESVAGDPRWGRFSIYGAEPVRVMTVPARTAVDPLACLGAACRPWRRLEPACDLPFVAGWIGYLAYEAGRFTEPTAGWRPQLGDLPLSHWVLFDTVLIHDRMGDRWYAAAAELPSELTGGRRPPATVRLDRVQRFVEQSSRPPPGAWVSQWVTGASSEPVGRSQVRFWDRPRLGPFPMVGGREPWSTGGWNFSRRAYVEKVERVLEYIRAGDVFQVNLARRLRTATQAKPIELYQRLCRANPAMYAAYLPILAASDGGPHAVVLSSSPELFLGLRDRWVTTRPIKGTRPRAGLADVDQVARRELAASDKDRAELNMIIDLERNDLGRVCEFGTVRVTHDGEIEACPTVFHRTATIVGRLRDDADAIDLLRAASPGGSVTGTPKVRAMQIINELEPNPRGAYCGAIGYISVDGDVQLNLAIRTMIVRGPHRDITGAIDWGRGRAAVRGVPTGRPAHRLAAPAAVADHAVVLYVGSGIVADSDPEEEFAELQAKAAGMLAALAEEATTDVPCQHRAAAAWAMVRASEQPVRL